MLVAPQPVEMDAMVGEPPSLINESERMNGVILIKIQMPTASSF